MKRRSLITASALFVAAGIASLNWQAIKPMPYPNPVYSVNPSGRKVTVPLRVLIHTYHDLKYLPAVDRAKLAAIRRQEIFQEAALVIDIAAIAIVAYWLGGRLIVKWQSRHRGMIQKSQGFTLRRIMLVFGFLALACLWVRLAFVLGSAPILVVFLPLMVVALGAAIGAAFGHWFEGWIIGFCGSMILLLIVAILCVLVRPFMGG